MFWHIVRVRNQRLEVREKNGIFKVGLNAFLNPTLTLRLWLTLKRLFYNVLTKQTIAIEV
ncbi:hypothetical protein B1A85_06490 [Chroococcidiopsis sp. TS-821]|nr:hypothetical protein B1A85_06490 [Chroococcidiopsis sp. TS-821]